ncbi:MAG: c-type cytochrome [Lunatimonas sp.]|uniref:c-type cytochrome n=1 Tax=Lunatimonas sp. TaxID=2060141 RepID=UPI00263BC65A|nr:c-type cytochrome [Lunatimonas sp.]MCC5938175.1 c-type cytochrome [Lunatimonas sp.]
MSGKLTWPRIQFALFLSSLLVFFACSSSDRGHSEQALLWKAPQEANHRLNPFQDEASVEAGRALYQVYCWSCHGESGMGDGAAGSAMGSIPANFHTQEFLSQTDGAIFWKISQGRSVMPSFEEVLSEQERWQVTAYIRKLGEGMAETLAASPISLREDVGIQHYLKVAARAVRIFYQPEADALWYATFEGEVYKIDRSQKPLRTEKVVSAADHGINRLQGATMHGNTLFLAGNIRVNDNKGTTGWMMRVELDPSGNHQVSKVFSTVEYGTTSTPFDHGWSAVRVSPDGRFLFVVSGSRTDHGEVQDNKGAYPNSRNEPLTAAIFRFPIDARDLVLPNDLEKLRNAGYLYAEGIRNAYDIDFDGDGNLFAVVNSGDYDQSEDMFWVREEHHYGFPWVMGGLETPQQFADWHPDPEKDPFLNTSAAAWPHDFYNDPDFPKRPEGVVFTPGMQNFGPDAVKYRDRKTGEIRDAFMEGKSISSFTAHSSPLGLNFDRDRRLADPYTGNAFTLRYTKGTKSSLMQPFTNNGEDLLQLRVTFDPEVSNFRLETWRIAEGFSQPVDAVLVKNELYVIEYGGRQRGGNIWTVVFPKK